MKVRAKIMSIDVSLKGEDVLDLSLAGTGKQHISMVLRVEVARALVKEYALGDQFEITLERVTL